MKLSLEFSKITTPLIVQRTQDLRWNSLKHLKKVIQKKTHCHTNWRKMIHSIVFTCAKLHGSATVLKYFWSDWAKMELNHSNRVWIKEHAPQTVLGPRLRVWWVGKGLLIAADKMIDLNLYCQQLRNLQKAFDNNWPEQRIKKTSFFHRRNVRLYTCLVSWKAHEILMHPPCSLWTM